jgi:hypothetical protein
MSLDVYLETEKIQSAGSGIFIRDNGSIREISREEWDLMYPDREPVVATAAEDNEVFWANITHNLGKMADVAGIYKPLWRPDEIGITQASQLIEPLRKGLNLLKGDPEVFSKYNASNGWGLYEDFVPFVEKYLRACEKYPNAKVRVSR